MDIEGIKYEILLKMYHLTRGYEGVNMSQCTQCEKNIFEKRFHAASLVGLKSLILIEYKFMFLMLNVIYLICYDSHYICLSLYRLLLLGSLLNNE